MEEAEYKDLKALCALCLVSGSIDVLMGFLAFYPLTIAGIAFVFVALGCRKLMKAAWYAGIAVSVASIAMTFLAVPFPFGIIPLVFGILVLYYLFKSDVKPLFFIEI